MGEKDESLLWSNLIFTGSVTKASKRFQIEISIDNGPKIVCPVVVEGPGGLHEQSRLLAFRLSSTLGIEVVRKSKLPGIKHTEGKCIASVAEFIKQDKTIILNGGISKITINVSLSKDHANTIIKGVDASLGALNTNPLFGRTSDAIDKTTYAATGVSDTLKTLSDVIIPLGQALQLMVKIGDNLADAHPLLKASWIVLSSVYKAVQKQKTQDDAVKELAESLREMLGAANACPDLREIENTTRVSESIGLAALDIASLIEECTRHTYMLSRVAQSQFKDLATRVTQCKELCRGLLEKFDRRVHLQNHSDLKDIKHSLNIELETKKKEEILEWLNAPDPSLNYIAAREKHCKGTGEWFLKRGEYMKWKAEPNLPLILWGAPGFGKTVLCSTVIEDIINHCTNAEFKAAYAYFIFDGRNLEADFQQHGKSIRSLIKQLSYRFPSFPLPLKTLCGDGSQKPTTKSLEDTLLKMATEFDDVFIIIDSLDECTEWDRLSQWIKDISESQTGNLHFFATSRPEYDVQEDLKAVSHNDFVLLEDHVSEDLQMFIQKKVQSSRKLNRLTPRMDVTETVSTNASGMFRLVALRLDQLQRCICEADIEEQLADLPNDLDEMYRQMIDRLQPEYRQRVLLILQWLAFSMRSIGLREVAEVVAVDFPGNSSTGMDVVPYFNPRRRLADENDILGICGGLVNVMSFGEIKLSHLSVREYLVSPRRQLESSAVYFGASLAHSAIAQTCIVYLLQFPEGVLPKDFRHNFPLASYAAQFWYRHAGSANEDRNLEDMMLHRLTMDLVLSDSNLERVTLMHDPHLDFYHYQHYPDISSLYYSALMGLRYAVAELLEHGADPNKEETKYLGNALTAAAIRGSAEIIEMLVEKGADPNLKVGYVGTPLLAAISWGHSVAVASLLERGANPNICESNYPQRSPLQIAALGCWTEIVKHLLNHGADINRMDTVYDNPLQDTCAWGFTAMVQLLLDNGADPNYNGESRPLQAAAYNNYPEIVNMLLAYGADPTLRGGYEKLGTALHAAAVRGLRPIVEIFMAAGGSLNSEGGKFGGVVQAASAGGHLELVKFLLDSGADPNLTGQGEYEHSLITATTSGDFSIVELLLQRGVNPNLRETKYALQTASANGNTKLVKLLLEYGADPNILGGWHGSSLQAAINGGFTEVVQLLLEHGANPNIYGPQASSPLYRAAEDGYLTITNLLLDKDADPSTNGGRYKTALHVAANNGYTNIVRLLIDKGADPNMPGAQGHGNPVHIASTNGHAPIVRLLLDRGADLDADGAKCAIVVASAEGYLDIVELLLERGANPNVSGGWYGTPLQAASLNGYMPIVVLLLANGANASMQAGNYGSALIAASYSGDLSIIDLLLEQGASLKRAGRYNALDVAAANGHAQVVEHLIKHGMNPNEINEVRGTPLHAAAKDGHAEVVKILLDSGANPNIRSDNKASALELASIGGYVSIVQLLLNKGANPRVSGPDGGPLQAAVIAGSAELVNLFLERGLDPDQRGGRYGSTIKAAVILGNQEVNDLLRQKGYELPTVRDIGPTDEAATCKSLMVIDSSVTPGGYWSQFNNGSHTSTDAPPPFGSPPPPPPEFLFPPPP
ncbi:ankyrin repeat-containing domain protein [Cyathus striatus]|nr:ankyrin repeat-containing domain protein [Cyathus striatus]